MTIIEKFNPLADEMFQVLGPDGRVVKPDLLPSWSDEKLREIYASMVFYRMADQKLISLQRQGRSGSYPSIEGQEAAQVGSGLAIQKSDFIFPAFRELAITHMHGVPLEKLYLYWMGNEWGSNFEANVAPISIPVGTHMLHATGFAWGLKMQKKSAITVSYFGDGATSEGDFYEAMNFAGVLNIPTVFFCQNNQWAISVSRAKQTAAKTLAQKAIACGMPGIQVDGNDIFAVHAVMFEAAERARSGHGPTLIEAVTYRYGNHTTSDDAGKYRSEAEVKEWRKRDPITRFKIFLQDKKLWDEDFEKKIIHESEGKIREAAEKAEKTPIPKPNEIFDYLYEKPTPALEEQKKYLSQFFPQP
ncbi:MAG: pyruvate dehydrogenase (acetyl-transferring) E1 component subunit alpha [Patescibacteria group bacterium]